MLRQLRAKIRPAILLPIISLVTLCSAVDSCEPRGRDLKHYEIGSRLEISLVSPNETAIVNAENALRDFVWRHFALKRPGCIEMSARSLEGMPKVTTYYIEPEPNGAWHVEIDSDWTSWDFKQNVAHRNSSRAKAYAVERVGAGEGRFDKGALIPESVDTPANSYTLKLKDSKGNVIEEL